MIRIGVLSDTHLMRWEDCDALAQRLMRKLWSEVDVVLHAGDIVNPDLLDCFGGKEVYAVRGNMDPPSPRLPNQRIVTFGGCRFGMVHGWGSPEGIEERVVGAFAGEELDVIIYGHSHLPICREVEGILLLNPGSATDRRKAPFHSVGLIEIDDNLSGRILRLDW
ncbi:MAG: hypothetical protein C0621_06270 [Desulfuromonas sp.]|nr:MAG: hypothetical protein C0621_06270 [Desulfuromonas sp.]